MQVTYTDRKQKTRIVNKFQPSTATRVPEAQLSPRPTFQTLQGEETYKKIARAHSFKFSSPFLQEVVPIV